MLELLGLILFIAFVANMEAIFDFLSDLLEHGMDTVRKRLGMKGKDDA